MLLAISIVHIGALGIFLLVFGSAVYYWSKRAKPDPTEEEDVTDITRQWSKWEVIKGRKKVS